MKSYGCTVHFNSPPSAVYEALTTERGLRGWLTSSCEIGRDVGDPARLEFAAIRCGMKIVKLVPEQKVEWRCVEHRLNAPDEVERDDEWVGTTLKFHLSERPDGSTELWFQHAGLTEELDCYEICNDAWEFYLCTSLKEYVDTGTGRPYAPSADRAPD